MDYQLNLFVQRGNFIANHIPHNFIEDAEVVVGYDIAHPSNPSPINLRVKLLNIFRKMFCGFANNFNVAQNGILNQFVARKLLKGETLSVLRDTGAGIENILQIKPVVT